jgi:hypothetical protein
MSRRPLPMAALVLGALTVVGGLCFAAFHALFEKVQTVEEGPFGGPAQFETTYVFRRFLEELGVSVEVGHRLPASLPDDMLVLWLSEERPPPELVRWLGAGGRAWTVGDPDLDPPESLDWTESEWEETAADAECGDDCLAAAQYHYGAGCLTLVERSALVNERVGKGVTPVRIDALLECGGRPTRAFLVTRVARPWFGELLVERAPEALVAGLVLMVLWLWRSAKHLGPRLPEPERARRRLLEHVVAVGQLSARVGLAPLLEAARREVLRELKRKRPQLAELAPPERTAQLARITQLSATDVELALSGVPDAHPGRLIAIARALTALWSKI